MSQSRLSHKLSLCELIHKLDVNECLAVIQTIHHECDCQNLNELLTKIILKLTDTATTDSLNNMTMIINDIISNTNCKQNNMNNSTKQIRQSRNNNNKLLRLPIDLINKTSSFLNEQDIFDFEKSSRLFYQIINNSLYLNQCNTFKTFILTPQKLAQMTQPKYSFYKYSKATTLVLQGFTCDLECIYSQEMKKTFDKAGSYDNWLWSMFKSIETLDVSFDGSPLLSVLPIELMFDPIESNLETFKMVCGINSSARQHFDQFRHKYAALKEKRVLQHVRLKEPGGYVSEVLNSVEAKHVELDSPHISFNSRGITSNQPIHSKLRMVTFNGNCIIQNSNKNEIENGLQWNIETLRFINVNYNCDIKLLYHEELIESLNLDNSVKHLTLNVACRDLEDTLIRQRWDDIISSLFTKKHFFRLENMNILFDFNGLYYSRKFLLDWIVGLMKQHKCILKHQFKQLNIVLHCAMPCAFDFLKRQERYDIVQWNPQINDTFLDQFEAKCNKVIQPTIEREQNEKIYWALKNKWLINTS